jgi:twinkle protein
VVKYCPFCHDHKDKPSNLWKLYISRGTGVYLCHRCGASGSWFGFKERLGDIHEPQRIGPSKVQTFKAPELDLHLKYQENLKHHPEVQSYLSQTRGLEPGILEKYQVGAALYDFPLDESTTLSHAPSKWQKHLCVTFPWTGDRKRLVRVKVRSIKDKNCMRLDPAGGAWGLFGWNTVPPEARTLVLTEGEFDAMAVHQATGLYAVSLPNGARSLPVDLLPRLERFRTIYLWMDNDIPGQEGAARFAQKLGIERCRIVTLPSFTSAKGEPLPVKDANEALLRGMDLSACIKSAAILPHEQIVTFESLKEEVHRELTNPEQVRGVPSKYFPSLTRIAKGFRPGEVTIITGPTGVGKTSFLAQLSLDYCNSGVHTLWGSFEIQNPRLAKKMLTQYAGKCLEGIEKADFEVLTEQFSTLPLYFLRFFGHTDVDKVIDAMDYAFYVHDVGHVLLDNLQFMTSSAYGIDKFEMQDRAMEKLRTFATRRNVHVTLVIHPRKLEGEGLLSTSSVFGTGKATQEADNVMILQKGKKYRFVDIRKNRFDGELGTIPLQFDRDSLMLSEMDPAVAEQLDLEAFQEGYNNVYPDWQGKYNQSQGGRGQQRSGPRNGAGNSSFGSNHTQKRRMDAKSPQKKSGIPPPMPSDYADGIPF